jgi:hypothetical protein
MKLFLLILYIGLLCFIFFGLPDSVVYSQDNKSLAAVILVFVVQPVLLYALLRASKVKRVYLYLLCPLSVLILGPLLGYYYGYEENKDFQERGKTTSGIIYKKWYNSGKNKQWLIRCHYVVNGQTYSTFSETDAENKYKVGDTLTVIYLEDYPQKCDIREPD